MRFVSLSICLTILLIAGPGHPQEGSKFSVGSVVAGAGQKVSGMLEVPAGVDASVSIPVTVAQGLSAGPVVALIAGTHGSEYPPITALQRVRATLDAQNLRGTVVLVHVANPASFFGRTVYRSPTDNRNMNRVYPGNPRGTQSERIAHAITTQVIEHADYVIDMHAGDGNEALRPFTYMPRTGNPDLDKGTLELALAFGLDHIVIDSARLRDPDDSLYVDQTALTRGIPAITTETGQLASNDDVWVDMAEQGVWNVLRFFEMIPGEAARNDNVVWLSDYTVVSSPQTGVFRAETRDGYAIAEGGRLGTLTNLFGEEIAVIRAPFAGIVNYVVGTPPVSEGEPIAMISKIAKAP